MTAPYRLVAWVTLAVFLAEAGIMLVLADLPDLPLWQLVVADAGILVLTLVPILLQTVVRPLEREIRTRIDAEAALRQTRVELEQRVLERTQSLASTNQQLERRSKQLAGLQELTDLLQTCQSLEETQSIVMGFAPRFFEDSAGGVYLVNPSGTLAAPVASWGNGQDNPETGFAPGDCWALRRGQGISSRTPERSCVRTELIPPSRGGTACVSP